MATPETNLTAEEQRMVQRFSFRLGWVLLMAAFLVFWAGANLMYDDVFTHLYNPARHTVISEDDAGNILAWQDNRGRIYTVDDVQHVFYPFAVTGLVLALMGVCYGLYQFLINHYVAMLVLRRWHLSKLEDILPVVPGGTPDGNRYAWP